MKVVQQLILFVVYTAIVAAVGFGFGIAYHDSVMDALRAFIDSQTTTQASLDTATGNGK